MRSKFRQLVHRVSEESEPMRFQQDSESANYFQAAQLSLAPPSTFIDQNEIGPEV